MIHGAAPRTILLGSRSTPKALTLELALGGDAFLVSSLHRPPSAQLNWPGYSLRLEQALKA
jgi:hypothetical protein